MKIRIFLCFSLLFSLLITGCTTTDDMLQTAISKNPELAKAIGTQISSDVTSGTTQPQNTHASLTPYSQNTQASITPWPSFTPTITEKPISIVEHYSVYLPLVICKQDE